MDIANTSAQYIKGVGPQRLKLLKRLGISTIKDCLCYLPRRYEDRSNLKSISQLIPEEFQTIKAKVASSSIFRARTGTTIFQLCVSDGTGKLYALWFNQPYMRKYFIEQDTLILYGKVQKTSRLQIVHPEYEIIREDDPEGEAIHAGRIVPIYPLVSGVNQRVLRRIASRCVEHYASYIQETLPTNIRARHRLLDLRSAICNIHFPANDRQLHEARRRLVFDEFFIHQLALAIRRYRIKCTPEGKPHELRGTLQDEFFKVLPFEITSAQKKAIEDIRKDMSSARPMHRLIQGEVGSGKTAVSSYALLLTAANNHQGVMMVPTEILARQHYINLSSFFSPLGIRVVLLINGLKNEEKKDALQLIESGEAEIIIGTHALFQKGVEFKDIGVIVIDEQHKFGVEQRALLKSKTQNPHMMVMTATPIPRTMAMTLYGDMDISVIDELPQGKRDVDTIWMQTQQIDKAYDLVKEQLSQERQAYIVYPAIEESSALRSEGAVRMYDRLKNEIFKEYKVGLIHGRLAEEEKVKVMKDFKKRKIDLLVATTIIEVGIDIPNASIMVIDNAERFGLSQLHQLRGRIGRSKFKSYCILVSDAKTDEAQQRLEVISKTDDGFRIAEEDLNIRGPGELFGKAQHGTAQLHIANVISDVGILEESRKEAFKLIAEDPSLKQQRHAKLRDILIENFKDKFHLGLIG